jgi:thymidine kinase
MKGKLNMAKLYFEFGAMSSSKTANALMTRFNYIEKGRNVWLIKPSTDNRSGESVVESRIGLTANADIIKPDDNIEELLAQKDNDLGVYGEKSKADVIIVDECQFLTEKQIDQLKNIASLQDITVMCFGLRTDFQSKLFAGSKRLMELADNIVEIKSICKCGEKAIINARINSDGKIITSGEQIEIGGNERYESMCWKCWQSKINKNKNKNKEKENE